MSTPTLAYDDLPPGSDMRREPSPDGQTIRIVVPAGEPPPAMVRAIRFRALAAAAPMSVAPLIIALALFYSALHNNRISGVPLAWAWLAFWTFCGSLFVLIIWIHYGLLLDALRAARQQQTAIAITPQRLLVETSGPFGDASHDFTPDAIDSLVVVPRGLARDARMRGRRVSYLVIATGDSRGPAILPGRDVIELRWVAGAISRTMNVAAVQNGRDA
jgi:hypothetical protein